MKFLGRLRVPVLTSAPSTPDAGEEYFDSTSNRFLDWNGFRWAKRGGERVPAYYPEDYGAVGDGERVSDGALTTGTATLSSSAAAFTVADAGKSIVVMGAGTAGANLSTTISSVSGGVATLAANASTTVSNAEVWYGTNDTTAMQSCIDAALAASGLITLSAKIYVVSSVPRTDRGGNCILSVSDAKESHKSLRIEGAAPDENFGASYTGIETPFKSIILTTRSGDTYASGPATTLSAQLLNTDTSASLTSAASWPTSGYFVCENEIIAYTGKATNTLTGLTRGKYGTTAATHASSTAVQVTYGPPSVIGGGTIENGTDPRPTTAGPKLYTSAAYTGPIMLTNLAVICPTNPEIAAIDGISWGGLVTEDVAVVGGPNNASFNYPYTTLAAQLLSTDTSASLTDASAYPNSGAFSVDNELITYTGKSGNSLTGLSRGQFSTSAATHTVGTSTSFRYVVTTAITNADTSVILNDASTFPNAGTAIIETEIVTYTGKSTNTLTGLSRGLYGTAAAAHAIGKTGNPVVVPTHPYAFGIRWPSQWGTAVGHNFRSVAHTFYIGHVYHYEDHYNVHQGGSTHCRSGVGFQADGGGVYPIYFQPFMVTGGQYDITGWDPVQGMVDLARDLYLSGLLLTETGTIYGQTNHFKDANNRIYGTLVLHEFSGLGVSGVPIGTLSGGQKLQMVSGHDRSTSIASAATLTLPTWADHYKITGSTNTTAITASYPGRRITLVANAVPTAPAAGWVLSNNGSTLRLWGDFAARAQGDNITLICDASGNWWEVSRSTAPKVQDQGAGTFTVLATDDVWLNFLTTGNNATLNLPTAATLNGKRYTFKKTDSSSATVTVTPNGSEKIDGASTYVLKNASESITIVSNGSNWFVI